MQNMTEYFGEPISIYTRAQAIEDGVLVDVSVTAREAGFKFPVAVTRTVWDGYVVPDSRARYYQDEMGRLWDILSVLRFYVRRGGSELQFPVTMNEGTPTPQHRVQGPVRPRGRRRARYLHHDAGSGLACPASGNIDTCAFARITG